MSLAVAGCEGAKPTPPANSAAQPRETIKKFTQNVLKLQDAQAQGGQIVHGGGEVGPSGGYVGTLAQAYRSSIGTIAVQQVQQALQMYEIQNNAPPKDYDEFMTAVLRKGQAEGIQLPQLPYYQEYAYDEANRQLVVVEFPARKAEFEKKGN